MSSINLHTIWFHLFTRNLCWCWQMKKWILLNEKHSRNWQFRLRAKTFLSNCGKCFSVVSVASKYLGWNFWVTHLKRRFWLKTPMINGDIPLTPRFFWSNTGNRGIRSLSLNYVQNGWAEATNCPKILAAKKYYSRESFQLSPSQFGPFFDRSGQSVRCSSTIISARLKWSTVRQHSGSLYSYLFHQNGLCRR